MNLWQWQRQQPVEEVELLKLASVVCKHLGKPIFWLVVLTILKNMKVNGKDYPICYGECLKPPTSLYLYEILNGNITFQVLAKANNHKRAGRGG